MTLDQLATFIGSGAIAAFVSGLVSHYSSKKLEVHSRAMEMRKDLYTKTSNQLSFFFSTVIEAERDDARSDLLKYSREIQIWGSDKVARSFKKLLDEMGNKDGSDANRNLRYKELIIAMRQDILGKNNLAPDEIAIRGLAKD